MSNNDDFSKKLLKMLIACQNEIVAITADEVKATKSGDAFVKGSDLSDALSLFIQERFPNLDKEHKNLLKTVVGELQESSEHGTGSAEDQSRGE